MQQYQGKKERLGAVFPLGIAYIATAIPDQHEVKVFDANLYDDPYPVLTERVRDFRPDVVGISLRNIDSLDRRYPFYNFQTIQPTIDLIKAEVPSAKIVLGGSGFSIFAEDVMKRISGVDFGVYLEGEETFVELLENMDNPGDVKGLFYLDNGEIVFTGARGLPKFEQLPVPRRDLFEMHLYRNHLGNIGVQTKRGCPLKCVYCSYPFLNGNRIRSRKPEHTVDEIEYLVNEFGIDEFMFVDGVFNTPMKQAVAICEEIIRRGLKVKWTAWCDIGSFTEEFLNLAAKAGCVHLPFSPDGATDASLEALGKGIKASEINRTLRLLKKYKHIRASFGFFCFPPRQTWWGLFKTIYFYLKINASLLGRGGASLAWIRVEPHTKIYDIAINEGIITENTDLLPEQTEELKGLFYITPGMRQAEKMVLSMLWIINKAARPLLGRRKTDA